MSEVLSSNFGNEILKRTTETQVSLVDAPLALYQVYSDLINHGDHQYDHRNCQYTQSG